MNAQLQTQAPRAPERARQRRTVTPPVDIFENNEELLLVADVPGAPSEAVTLRFERNQLAIEARCEVEGFDYVRSFALPGGVDPERIRAELRDGVLTVHLPRHDRLRPRQISVTTG
ncbi:MAG: Hsp20/alpha crystallin family protein [Deltaproteobacteria bacterium]|nr:Hsp20/alpha crystallin family protein [Deltaproteobacteria bacterium]